MRPRANTISHVDGTQIGMMMAMGSSPAEAIESSPEHPGLESFPPFSGVDYQGPPGRRGPNGLSHRPHNLARIETRGLPPDLPGNLRTAPPFPHFPPDCAFNGIVGPTVNPAQLHLMDSPASLPFHPASPFPHGLGLEGCGIPD